MAHGRPPVTCVKVRKVKIPSGAVKEQHDLIITIDLVSTANPNKCRFKHISSVTYKEKLPLSKEFLADLKEVFMLFDKDEDGVLTFTELEVSLFPAVGYAICLQVVMKCLGQRLSEPELLRMVREVSQDKTYDTIEVG